MPRRASPLGGRVGVERLRVGGVGQLAQIRLVGAQRAFHQLALPAQAVREADRRPAGRRVDPHLRVVADHPAAVPDPAVGAADVERVAVVRAVAAVDVRGGHQPVTLLAQHAVAAGEQHPRVGRQVGGRAADAAVGRRVLQPRGRHQRVAGMPRPLVVGLRVADRQPRPHLVADVRLGRRHPERLEDLAPVGLLVRLARQPLEQHAERLVAGVRVPEPPGRHHRRPRQAEHRHRRRRVLVQAHRQPGGVGQKLVDGDAGHREQRQQRAHLRLQVELAALDAAHQADGGERLGDRADLEQRVRRDRSARRRVGEPVAAHVEAAVAVGDRQGEAGGCAGGQDALGEGVDGIRHRASLPRRRVMLRRAWQPPPASMRSPRSVRRCSPASVSTSTTGSRCWSPTT